ncbi:LOW QUALITY PROTEIN: hypothetical protein M514_08635 [Trichuris suis]|uniref:Peptidase A2 domain-containing protein n=1 Tax=Trichuris suis TaxID=68888 RepID=A0A085N3J6_9BILA|nr:LOW QUALITY PROTEIN: hypothetical protein M514_08635 [Trichuris suis]
MLMERLRDHVRTTRRVDPRPFSRETSLTYDEAVKRAQAGEAAASQVKELQAQKPSIDVPTTNQLRQTNSAKKILPRDSPSASRNICASCGSSHSRKDCKFRNAECNFCHKKGHIAKVCRSKTSLTKPSNKKSSPSTGQPTTHMLNESSNEVYAQNFVNSLQQAKPAKVRIVVQIQGQPCAMEADSGSDFSVISSKTYSKLWPTRGRVIRPFSSHIRDYQKNPIRLKGYCKVEVAYKHYKKKLRFLITEGVHQTHSEDGIRTLLEEFADVFNENLGTYKGPKVTLPIDPKVPPSRLKARNVPLAIRPRVEAEIKRLLKEKVLEPISNPKWSTPVVPVIKPTGATRLCDDYKITINTALQDPSISSTISNTSAVKSIRRRILFQN